VKGSETQKPQAQVICEAASSPGGSCLALNKEKFVSESCIGDWAQMASCPGWVGDDSTQGEEDGAQTSTAMARGCHGVPNTQQWH